MTMTSERCDARKSTQSCCAFRALPASGHGRILDDGACRHPPPPAEPPVALWISLQLSEAEYRPAISALQVTKDEVLCMLLRA